MEHEGDGDTNFCSRALEISEKEFEIRGKIETIQCTIVIGQNT